ncbi:hypothetical protein [Cyclobacterium plantarum]|uniref:hypothetical protein n=1 Tax=Cyclobacterium plantarum TaxID=2716263 RepID=UPI003F7015C3
MTTWILLVLILYGVVTKCYSFNSLHRNRAFLEDNLIYLVVDKLPAVSTLSDSKIKRNIGVLEPVYRRLLEYYNEKIRPVKYQFLVRQLEAEKSRSLIPIK